MTVGAVIVAAGAGTRLGGVAKALLPLGDTTFLDRIVARAIAAGVAPSDVIVVVGAPFAPAVAAAARALGTTAIVNPDPGRGMASSIGVGVAALADSIERALMWPVDHPLVAATTVATLLAAGVGVPTYHGRGGHPPLVPRALFAALVAADHPDGARGVLRGLPRIAVDDPGVVRDIDLPADRAEAEAACAG